MLLLFMPLEVNKEQLSNRVLRMREDFFTVVKRDIIKEIRFPYKLKPGE